MSGIPLTEIIKNHVIHRSFVEGGDDLIHCLDKSFLFLGVGPKRNLKSVKGFLRKRYTEMVSKGVPGVHIHIIDQMNGSLV